MLVILDRSLIDVTKTDHASIAGLESVLSTSYNGEHFLTSTFPVIHALLKLPLSIKGRAVLNRIRSNASLHGHLPYPGGFTIEIVSKGLATRKSNRMWSMPVTDFKNKPFPPSVILGENMLDAEAYFSAAQQARIKYGYSEICRAVPDAGGGSQTTVKLQGYLNHTNGYCFCVTDGDYREPTGSKSSVTSSCETLSVSAAWPTYSTDFHARSIENIIPIELLEDSYGQSPLPQVFHTYKKIYDFDNETGRYIDAKIGLRYCGILKMKNGSERHNFWISKIKKHNLEHRLTELTNNPPKCTDSKCSECSIISGLGGGTLKQVVDYFNKTTTQKLAQRVSINSLWCELGLNIYHWTFADKPVLS